MQKTTKLGIKQLAENTTIIKTNPIRWIDNNFGSMKDSWQEVDTTQLLKDLRNDWDKFFVLVDTIKSRISDKDQIDLEKIIDEEVKAVRAEKIDKVA